MTFARRQLTYKITIAKGAQGNLAGQTINLEGHRSHAQIHAYGGESQGEANVSILGLPLDVMNQLTTIGPIMTQIRAQNRIQIFAADEGETPTEIYRGVIMAAWSEGQRAPDVPLIIRAFSAMDIATNSAAPTSFKGVVSADTLLKRLAAKANLQYEGTEITGSLSNPYLKGSLHDQIRAAARAAGVNAIVENGALVAWPKGGARKTYTPTIGPDEGLVNYPSFSSQFLMLTCEFLPTIKVGGQITVQNSQITMANGTWTAFSVAHDLACEAVDGPWFTHVEVWNRAG